MIYNCNIDTSLFITVIEQDEIKDLTDLISFDHSCQFETTEENHHNSSQNNFHHYEHNINWTWENNMNDLETIDSQQFDLSDSSIQNKEYVTPRSYGAVGDGVHDDTIPFQRAIASGKSVVVPSGTYYLSTIVMADESQVIKNDGIYTYLPFMVSRKFEEQILFIRKKYAINTADILTKNDKWLGGVCYDSLRDRVIMAFGDHSKTSYLVALSSDFSTKILESTIESHHANSITYNNRTDKIYVTTGDEKGKILEINPETLEVERTIVINTSITISSIVYWDNYNLYLIGGKGHVHITDSAFRIIKKSVVRYGTESFFSELGLLPSEVNFQSFNIVNGQIVHLIDEKTEPGFSHILQYNYTDSSLKCSYRYSDVDGKDECEAIANVKGKWYTFNVLGYKKIFINEIVFNKP